MQFSLYPLAFQIISLFPSNIFYFKLFNCQVSTVINIYIRRNSIFGINIFHKVNTSRNMQIDN